MKHPVVVDDHDREARHFPRGTELASIAAFWAVFGALSITNWLFPPFGNGPQVSVRVVAIGLFGPILWLIATPALFWLTSRYSVEREERVPTIVFYLVVGLAVAFLADVFGELARMQLAPPVFPGQTPRPRPPFWNLVRGRLLNEYMVCLAVIAAGVARDYFTRYHRRLEESTRLRAQLVEARLTVLQNQLNPHFLFNTLNAVSALVDRDPRGVRRMIARLSELLRASLEPSSDPEVAVSREAAMIERYLEILRIRFQGRLETSVDVAPDVQDALVPPMILQPLVENAMKHAVSRTSGPSRIDVSVERRGDALVLMVQDTGAGKDEPDDEADAQPGMGIGLSNTRARLAEIYDDDYSLDLIRAEHGGLTVSIRLPFHTARDVKGVLASEGALR